MLVTERDDLTEKIVIEIMPVNEIIEVAYYTELTEYLHFCTELLFELS